MKKAPVTKHQARCLHDVGTLVQWVAAWAASRTDVAGICINLMSLPPNGRVILDVRVKAFVPGLADAHFVFVVHLSTDTPLSRDFVKRRLRDLLEFESARVVQQIEAGLAEHAKRKPKAKARPKAAPKKGGRR